MNYNSIYENLIAFAIQRNLKKLSKSDQNYIYLERHHIFPRSLGGQDVDSNLVNLTAREHYFAHHLLVKITFKEYGEESWQYKAMLSAFHMMIIDKKHISYVTARMYEYDKKLFGQLQSQRLSGQGNPQYGKRWMYNPSTNEYIYVLNDKCEKYLQIGFIFQGRNKGIKTSDEARKHISENHADFSGEKNPMFGKCCTDFMSEEKAELWKQHLKERDLNGSKNGAYNKKWIRNILTDEQNYVDVTEVQMYLDTGEWELGQSKTKVKKMSKTLQSESTQMKNLQTRFPEIDFSEFDYSEYRQIPKEKRPQYRQEYAKSHLKKLH